MYPLHQPNRRPVVGHDRARFCTDCGRSLVFGLCPDGHRFTADEEPQPSPVPAQPPAPRPRRRLRPSAVGVLAVVPVILLGGLAVTQGRRLAELDGQVATLEVRQRQTDRALDSRTPDEALSNLASRLADVESAATGVDVAEVVARVQASVFTVEIDDGVGSAFVVGSSGGRSQLLTNYHVVVDSYGDVVAEPLVSHEEGTLVGEVISTSPHDDLAIIEVPGTFPSLTWAADRPRVGDSVMALGSPLGLGGSVSSGIVSAFRTEDGLEYLQFSAPVSPGNSGGPVVDRSGAVVGVTVAKMTGDGAEGLSFAIPYERACEAVDLCSPVRSPLRSSW